MEIIDCRYNICNIYSGGMTLASLLIISLILCPISIGMPRSHQAFAQNSTNAIHIANLQADGAIQALNDKVNGTVDSASKPTLAQVPTNTKVGQARCIASTLDIQTFSRGVPNRSNPNSGTVSMSAIETFNRVVPNPSNPNYCIASTLAIQTLSTGVPNPSNPSSGAATNPAIQALSTGVPNPSNPSKMVPTASNPAIQMVSKTR
jgi:hypothetical protein